MNLRRILLLATASLLVPFAATAQEALRVVTDATFPPMEFQKDGKRTGFDIELTEALAAARRKMVIELLTEWIRITSSVRVIVTSIARGSRKSLENRRRLAISECPRMRSAS